jgi:ABC-type transporter Mla subunit MlaD
VAVHGDLLKRLEQQQKERKELDAKDRALAAAAKALPGKLSAVRPKMQQALKALAEAKAKAGNDAASLAKIGRSMQDLNMIWIDLSVFQDLQGY